MNHSIVEQQLEGTIGRIYPWFRITDRRGFFRTGTGYQKKTPVPEVWVFGAQSTHALILGDELHVSSAPNLRSSSASLSLFRAAPRRGNFVQHLYFLVDSMEGDPTLMLLNLRWV